MKLKIFFATILTLVLGVAFLAQTDISNALAQTPVTSPVTGPATGPITFAGFKLQGNVSYRILGRFGKLFGKIIPAVGVKVTAEDRSTGAATDTTTDSDGNYLFLLPSAKYKVTVEDAENTFFVPPFRLVNLHKDTDYANFQGLQFSH